MNSWRRLGGIGGVGAALLVMLTACSSGGQGSTAPSESASTSAEASAGTASTPATPTVGPSGPASLDAPQEVAAGATFEIEWTGPRAQQDYITIVAAGATKWTNEPYFFTTGASPGTLVAPVTEGAYALWYVSGVDDTILAQRDIQVLAFVGDLGGPAEVMAGSRFEVAWNGPNGPGDYVTIVKAGTTKWTNESYFYTARANPGELFADLEPGAYELWYVTGADDSTEASKPITVTPYVVTLDADAQVARGATFEVEWTGPDGPSDYVTIVLASSAPGTFGDYQYTLNRVGQPITLQAPDTAGNYEIRYQSDRADAGDLVFLARPITVN